ncbi:MAG: hypothetical protein CMM05_05620, partial [Rhodopirellula sp.]|nr:hypothetical protein [Rhodopirellula sp.]
MLAEFEVALASLADGGHALDYTVKHRITLSSSAGSAYACTLCLLRSAFYALTSNLCLLFPNDLFLMPIQIKCKC